MKITVTRAFAKKVKALVDYKDLLNAYLASMTMSASSMSCVIHMYKFSNQMCPTTVKCHQCEFSRKEYNVYYLAYTDAE